MRIFQLDPIQTAENERYWQSSIITETIIIRAYTEARARRIAACATSKPTLAVKNCSPNPSPWLESKHSRCTDYSGDNFQIDGLEEILSPKSLQKALEEMKPVMKKFNDLINDVIEQRIFPTNALFNGGYKDRHTYSCEIHWHLNNDERRQNKYSRPIELIITTEVLEDCDNLEKAKIKFKKFLNNRLKEFNPDHDEVDPKSEPWIVKTLDLND